MTLSGWKAFSAAFGRDFGYSKARGARSAIAFAVASTAGFAMTGCALLRSTPDSGSESASQSAAATKTPQQLQIERLETQLAQLQSKVDGLEEEIAAAPKKRASSGKTIDATELVQSSVALTDPEKGFVQDNAVLSLRQSKVLYDSEKFPEAVLGFATFVERHATHPLASQAQYYLADSYFRQNDYPVAEQEFRRLLREYPQTNFASQARARLKTCAEHASGVRAAPAPARETRPKSETPSTEESENKTPSASTTRSRATRSASTSATTGERMEVGQSSALRREPAPSAAPAGESAAAAPERLPSASDLDLAPLEEAPAGE